MKACITCHCISSTHKRCFRCKETYYCSVECQRADWAHHKQTCGKLIPGSITEYDPVVIRDGLFYNFMNRLDRSEISSMMKDHFAFCIRINGVKEANLAMAGDFVRCYFLDEHEKGAVENIPPFSSTGYTKDSQYVVLIECLDGDNIESVAFPFGYTKEQDSLYDDASNVTN